MKVILLIFLILLGLINSGCDSAMQCISVNNQNVCFVRQVWGFNGDQVWLTTKKNRCQPPSKETDYISNSLRSSEVIKYKVTDEKLYIYAETMDKPNKQFPVEVILEDYEPLKEEKDLIEEGYRELPLHPEISFSCF